MKKIAVIGTGYVGLVSGTCFAETGNQVICVDINEEKVERMRNGEVPIYEPHLDVVFERNIKEGRIEFTTNLKEAVDFAEIIFLVSSECLNPKTPSCPPARILYPFGAIELCFLIYSFS